MKILVIEDEKELSDSIVKYLKQEGYVVETAKDFYAADEKVGIYNYDCLIVDISLPGGSGLDIIRKVKKNQKQAGVIIISAKN